MSRPRRHTSPSLARPAPRAPGRSAALGATVASGLLALVGAAGCTLSEDVYMRDVTQLTMGHDVMCGLAEGGHTYCAGENDYGQLGVGTTSNGRAFSPVLGLENQAQVAVGGSFACSLSWTGELRCWGRNGGRFDTSGDQLDVSPVPIEGLPPVRAVAIVDRQIFVAGADGVVRTVYGPETHPVRGFSRVVTLRAGSRRLCGIDEDGHLACTQPVAADDPPLAGWQLVARPITALQDVTDVAIGWHHTCAIAFGGLVFCWGEESYGELGDGVDRRPEPTRVPHSSVVGVGQAVSVLVTDDASLAALADGRLVCWGGAPCANSGPGARTIVRTARRVRSAGPVRTLVGFRERLVFLTDDGRVFHGDQRAGQLDLGPGLY